MPATVGSWTQTVKHSCDNDTFLFCFQDSKIAKAYGKKILETPWISRVQATNFYSKYDDEGNFIGYDEEAIAKAGNVAYDFRTTLSFTKIIDETDTVGVVRRTTKQTIQNKNGTSKVTTSIIYIYGGAEYSEDMAIEGSVNTPKFNGKVTSQKDVTPSTGLDVVNRDYLRVNKYENGDWVVTKFYASYMSDKLSSGYYDNYYGYKDSDNTYKIQCVMKRGIVHPILNTYYKNSNGVWVNYNEAIRIYPAIDISTSAVMYEERLKIPSLSLLPKCEYIDDEGTFFNIDEGDGQYTHSNGLKVYEIDTVKGYTTSSVKYTFTVDNPLMLITYLSYQTPKSLAGFTFDHWSLIKDGIEIQNKDNRRLEKDEVIEVYAVYYNKTDVILYEPMSIDDATVANTKNARPWLCDDLKITLPEEYSRNNFLTWLNGAFVPTLSDNTNPNVMYIENAMTMVWSWCINQKLGSSITKSEENATVTEDSANDEYRYNINCRLFGWQGVSVSNFYKPQSSSKVAIYQNYDYIEILNTITFPIEVNVNAHFIICNGKVLSSEDYTVDENDNRIVHLIKAETEAYDYLSEITKEINDNIEYYPNVNPLRLLKNMSDSRNYSLVNFYSIDNSKEIYLKQSNAVATDFPFKGEITFANLNIGDLVLVNGLFVPYLWVHDNTIKFPKVSHTYADGIVDALTPNDIVRYFFISENKN